MQIEKPKQPRRLSHADRGKPFYFTDRDTHFLKFLWRWKLASTASLHEAVGKFDETTGKAHSQYATYKTLERLRRHGYLQNIKSMQYRFNAWQLTDSGFEEIRASLGELIEDGYLSENLWHDRNVLAFQLAEWPHNQIPAVEHFTEQELRRRPKDCYPSWVPPVYDRRPDGYTLITGKAKPYLIAYEVELTAKSISKYEAIIKFYRAVRHIDRVYWLIGDPMVKNQIIQAKSCTKDPADNYHVFVDLKVFSSLGWEAPVTNCRSETLFTIRENMRGILGEPYGELTVNMGGASGVTVHYDPGKVIGKSKPS